MRIIDRDNDLIARDEMYGEERTVARVQYWVGHKDKTVEIGVSDFLPHLDAYALALEMVELLAEKYPEAEGWKLVTTPRLCETGHALIRRSEAEGHNFFAYVGSPDLADPPTAEILQRLAEADN